VSFRDDHDAALMRADAAVREAKLLADENTRLTSELAAAKEWLGGPRVRILVAAVIVVTTVGISVGALYGRSSVECPVPVATRMPAPPLPQVIGVMVADGPVFGHWTLNATRCVPRDDGIELTAVGSEDHNIWLAGNDVEVETPTGAVTLKHLQCIKRLESAVTKHDGMYDGHVDVDCRFDDNRLHGRIEFRNCR
jgi:hypothetical protein